MNKLVIKNDDVSKENYKLVQLKGNSSKAPSNGEWKKKGRKAVNKKQKRRIDALNTILEQLTPEKLREICLFLQDVGKNLGKVRAYLEDTREMWDVDPARKPLDCLLHLLLTDMDPDQTFKIDWKAIGCLLNIENSLGYSLKFLEKDIVDSNTKKLWKESCNYHGAYSKHIPDADEQGLGLDYKVSQLLTAFGFLAPVMILDPIALRRFDDFHWNKYWIINEPISNLREAVINVCINGLFHQHFIQVRSNEKKFVESLAKETYRKNVPFYVKNHLQFPNSFRKYCLDQIGKDGEWKGSKLKMNSIKMNPDLERILLKYCVSFVVFDLDSFSSFDEVLDRVERNVAVSADDTKKFDAQLKNSKYMLLLQ